MTTRSFRTLGAAGAAVAATLTVPQLVAAHPSVFEVTPNKVTATTPTVTIGPDVKQYAISQHGYTRVLKETNGLTTNGILTYKKLPGAWRSTVPKSTVLSTGDTGAQPHAVCISPKLGETEILAWQGADPFYNYVPWQKTIADLDDADERDAWIAVVQTATGFDLNTLPDAGAAAAAEAACEDPAVGNGTYYAADTTQTAGSSFASADIARVADPLNLQITDLTGLLGTATAAKTAAETELAQLKATLATTQSKLAAESTALTVKVTSGALSPAALAQNGVAVSLTGVPNDPVRVELLISERRAAKLGLSSRVIGVLTTTLDASGKQTGTITLTKQAAKRIAKETKSLPLSVTARVDVAATTSILVK